jgi:hypothetical protein
MSGRFADAVRRPAYSSVGFMSTRPNCEGRAGSACGEKILRFVKMRGLVRSRYIHPLTRPLYAEAKLKWSGYS